LTNNDPELVNSELIDKPMTTIHKKKRQLSDLCNDQEDQDSESIDEIPANKKEKGGKGREERERGGRGRDKGKKKN
jgi:hypothetical protein